MKKIITILVLVIGSLACKAQCGISQAFTDSTLNGLAYYHVNAGNATLVSFTFGFTPTQYGNPVRNPFLFGGGGDMGIYVDMKCALAMTATVEAYYFDPHTCVQCSPAQLDSMGVTKCVEVLTYQAPPCPTVIIGNGRVKFIKHGNH